ncbi:MAG TPA: SusC/RagA family TonB-linked outer membrane protein [Prolixibacteraceae bacterium]|nr:SusC/RagA family TonB-linked outer membrane protein [Prolixibacteraceae bacterium]
MKKIAFFLSIMFFMGTVLVHAQTRSISGTVTSAEDNQPIPGVSVSVKGTTLGTITNIDGGFELTIPQDAQTLIFSFIGMKNYEVAIANQSTFTVKMETDVFGIDEVVVTALGISREKKSLGYASQDVKSEELMEAAAPDAISALQGKVAGVQISQAGGQVGASSRIVIRGNSSFGNNQPLIVVDGIPYSNGNTVNNGVDFGSGLYDINPNNIESLTVLKGGAAAALYGMRAGNGVILITTKSGKSKAKGVSVEYDGNFNVDQVYHIQKYQNKYGQGYLGDEWFYKEAQADGYTGSYQDFATGGYDAGYGFAYVDGIGNGVNDGVDESWGPRLDIGLKIPQYTSPVDANGNITPTAWVSNPSNVKDFYQLGFTTNHTFALTSVTDNSTTRASIGYSEQQGTMPNTDQTRYTAALNTDMTINKYLKYDLSMNYTRTESDNLPITGYNASNPMQSMGQWFGRQVDVKALEANWQTTMPNGFPYNWNSNYHNNPYWSMFMNTNSYQRDRIFGKSSMWITPTEFLKFEGRIGLDYYNSNTNPVTYAGSNETLLDASTATFSGGWFRENEERQSEFNADFIGYFDKTFGDFSVSALAGANYRNLRWSSLYIGANDLTVPNLFTIANVKGSTVAGQDNSWIRTNSVYAQGTFGYGDFLFVDVLARNDWSSTIKDPFFYPAVSVSWLPLQTFEIESDIISFLKLRGGWAKVGNATGAYRTDPYFSAITSTIYGVSQYQQATEFPPAGLKPEQVVTSELGLEINFLQNRIGLDVALYDKTTTDQIMSVPISKATGYSTTLVNAGEINNKGIEIQLRGAAVKNADGFNWDIYLNWAKDQSEVIELYTDPVTLQKVESYNLGSEWSTNVQARPGEPWGVIYGTGMVRRESDGAIIVAASGRPRTKTNMKLGSVTPDWIGGLRNEFSYKNFTLGFLLDMRSGGDIFSISQMFGAYAGQLEFTADKDFRENGLVLGKDFLTDEKFVKVVTLDAANIQNSEFAENDLTTGAQDFFESYYGNRELSVYDGSYVKLREAHFTYTLPSNLFSATSLVKGASVSLVGNNLGILWTHKSNISGLDPENSTGSGNGGVGLESTSYPPSRSIGLKLNLKF